MSRDAPTCFTVLRVSPATQTAYCACHEFSRAFVILMFSLLCGIWWPGILVLTVLWSIKIVYVKGEPNIYQHTIASYYATRCHPVGCMCHSGVGKFVFGWLRVLGVHYQPDLK